MKRWLSVVCAVIALGCEPALADAWQPSAGHAQTRIWPGTPPDAKPMAGPEIADRVTKNGVNKTIAGKPYSYVTRVFDPTMTVYSPKGTNTGVAVVVFPGDGYNVLAIDLEGTKICEWLASQGITGVLLEYRCRFLASTAIRKLKRNVSQPSKG